VTAVIGVRPPGVDPWKTIDFGRSAMAVIDPVAGARAEMFAAFVERLNAAGIPYCLLSGYGSYPYVGDSDVDFMVRLRDGTRIAPLLREVAGRCCGLLVQAIQHETGACYFVLAKHIGDRTAYLHLDCATDYRREGRLWLAAEDVLKNRRRSGAFFVAAAADEFQYYIIKKTLKQQISAAQLQGIRTLYLTDPEECCGRLRRFWSKATAGALVSAILTCDVTWGRLHLATLLAELQRSAPLENWRQRGAQQVRELRRLVERVINPTGLTIGVCGGNAARRSRFAESVVENLRPAFRRARVVKENDMAGVRSDVSLWLATVRSALVIRTSSLGRTNETSFDLSDGTFISVASATRIVLEWMAERQRRRMPELRS
jgi:hypothetical protein